MRSTAVVWLDASIDILAEASIGVASIGHQLRAQLGLSVHVDAGHVDAGQGDAGHVHTVHLDVGQVGAGDVDVGCSIFQ